MSDAEGAPEVKEEEEQPQDQAADAEEQPKHELDAADASEPAADADGGIKRSRDEAGEGGEEPPAKRAADDGAEGQPCADPSAAAAAAAVLAAAAPPAEACEVVQVPSDKVGKVIGRQGQTIKELQQRSSARIKIDHNAPGDSKPVSIFGSPAAIAMCKTLIHEVLESDQPLASAGEVSQTIQCPQGLVGRIIGRGGETIRSLQTASGAHIMVNQKFPDGVPRQIDLTGRPDAVERAFRMIKDLIEGEQGNTQMMIQKVIEKHGVGVTQVMTCEKTLVGRIIGKGGETIKALQKTHQASIQIDQNTNPCKITITGPAGCVQAAQQAIQNVMNGGDLPGMGGPPMGGPMGMGGYGGYGGGFQPGYGGGFQPPAYGGPGPYGQAPAPYGGPGYGHQYGGGGGYGQGYGQQPAYGGYGQQEHYAGAHGHAAPQYQQQAAPQQSVWQEQHDDQGRTYYYNTQTGQSQWEKPADMP